MAAMLVGDDKGACGGAKAALTCRDTTAVDHHALFIVKPDLLIGEIKNGMRLLVIGILAEDNLHSLHITTARSEINWVEMMAP